MNLFGKKTWTTAELASEAAKRGKPVTQEYIRKLCAEGRLQAEKRGRDWHIDDSSARNWLNQWLQS